MKLLTWLEKWEGAYIGFAFGFLIYEIYKGRFRLILPAIFFLLLIILRINRITEKRAK